MPVCLLIWPRGGRRAVSPASFYPQREVALLGPRIGLESVGTGQKLSVCFFHRACTFQTHHKQLIASLTACPQGQLSQNVTSPSHGSFSSNF